MTATQLHFLKPGDRVRRKGDSASYDEVEGVVLYLTADDQVVDAVKLRGMGMLQRKEILNGYQVVMQ